MKKTFIDANYILSILLLIYYVRFSLLMNVQPPTGNITFVYILLFGSLLGIQLVDKKNFVYIYFISNTILFTIYAQLMLDVNNLNVNIFDIVFLLYLMYTIGFSFYYIKQDVYQLVNTPPLN